MKMLRIVALLALVVPAVALAQESEESPWAGLLDAYEASKEAAQTVDCRRWGDMNAAAVVENMDAVHESGCAYAWERSVSGDYVLSVREVPQESDASAWANFFKGHSAACTPAAWQRDPDGCSWRLGEIRVEIKRQIDNTRATENRRRIQEAELMISSIEAMQRANEQAAQRAEAEAARKSVADAQLQAHMQSIAARKSQEWQNQLWLWQAQGEARAQQQYQQQLLQQQRWNQTQQQWFQRDLVRAIEGLAPPHCYWSIVKQRNVCY